MSSEMVALMVLLLLIASAVLFARHRASDDADDEHGLPAELRGAEIAFAEQTFRSRGRRLVARLDRAYRTPTGLQLVELKTRARNAVYMSDVIELSVQRIAVADETGESVSSDAWVVIQRPGRDARMSHKVRLMGVEEIAAMSERYGAVVRGKVGRPNAARSISQCAQCVHRTRCSATYQDRR